MRLVFAVAACALGATAATRHSDDLYTKPDPRGWSCIRCHSPTGAEFRLLGFTQADIERRAAKHISSLEARTLSALLMQGRKERAPDPLQVPPFMPGGQLLRGSVAEVRDLLMGEELSTRLPVLFGQPIRNLSRAVLAKNELLKLNPSELPCGIPMPLASMDVFHGPQFASLNNWFSDLPTPDDPKLVAARESYRGDPNDANFAKFMDAVRSLRGRTFFEQISLAKYASLCLWAHYTSQSKPIKLPKDFNPLWAFGDIARLNSTGDEKMLGMPSDIVENKTKGPSLAEQMKDVAAEWMWMGWTLDPSLTHSQGGIHATLRGDYFIRALERSGPYPIHTFFALTKKFLEQGYRRENWTLKFQQHPEIQYSFALIDGDLFGREPKLSEQQALFRKLCTNAFRMDMLLVIDDVQRTGGCIRPESQLNQIKWIKQYFAALKLPVTDMQLCARAEKAIIGARVDGR